MTKAEIIQEMIDKLQIKFEKAIRRGLYLKSQQIDDVIYRLNKEKEKELKNEKAP